MLTSIPAQGASIQLEHVTKRYGQVTAVDDISLFVAPGRFVSLLGPSGAGKTTILHLIAGLIERTSGSIRINGRHIEDIPSHKRNVGVVFQNYALFPHLTVEQNLAFPLEMRRAGRSQITRRVADALHLVGLSGLERRRPRQLSGGQQQRVALARALIYRPDVILMDEPLGALDNNLRTQMQVEIKALQGELGLTIVYVTHDQSEALAMSDEICVLSHGRVAQIGEPRQIYDRPRSAFVATFLGEANLFPGAITTIDRGASMAIATGPYGLLSAAPLDGLAADAAVTIIVRPEDITIAEPARDGVGVPARVEAIAFVGDALRVQLAAGDGRRIVAKLPKEVSNTPSPGSSVLVSWQRDKATFVPGHTSDGPREDEPVSERD